MAGVRKVVVFSSFSQIALHYKQQQPYVGVLLPSLRYFMMQVSSVIYWTSGPRLCIKIELQNVKELLCTYRRNIFYDTKIVMKKSLKEHIKLEVI